MLPKSFISIALTSMFGTCLVATVASSELTAKAAAAQSEDFSAYLFAYFVGNGPGQEQIHFAVSEDGFNYRALNGNRPIVDSRDISSTGGVRDPHILRGATAKPSTWSSPTFTFRGWAGAITRWC